MSRTALRILHVIGSISPARGGTSVAVLNMVKALSLHHIDADVATTDDDGTERRSAVALDRFVSVDGLRVRHFPQQTTFYAASWPLLNWLRAHISNYDVVHTHGLFGFAPMAAARVARSQRVPYVMSPHGMLDNWGRVNRRPLLKRCSIQFVEGPLLRRAARVHFTSNLELEQASDARLLLKQVIIPLGLDIAMPGDIGGASRFESELANIDRGAVVLYLSRIAPKKGLDVLLRAFALTAAEHRSATLLIAGDGPAPLVAEFQRLALDLGLSARQVRWLGFVQGADKHWLLTRSTLFALPSKSENFGFAAAEAIAAGLPVVLTHGVAMAELAGKATCGIVMSGTVEETHRAMSTLLGNAQMRADMAASGKRFAREFLSLDAFGKRLEELYRQVIEEQPVSGGAARQPGRVDTR